MVFFEEFKGTGNMELHLDRRSAPSAFLGALTQPRSPLLALWSAADPASRPQFSVASI
jgi:hypothetical protein